MKAASWEESGDGGVRVGGGGVGGWVEGGHKVNYFPWNKVLALFSVHYFVFHV